MNNKIITAFYQVAATDPEKIAIVNKQDNISYSKLKAIVDTYKSVLMQFKGDRVAIHLNRSVDLIATMLACIAAGKTFIALDPKQPQQRRDYILQDAASGLLITDSEINSKLELRILPLTQLKMLAEVAVTRLSIAPAAKCCYMLYTSGSTGKPKGIKIAYAGLITLIDWAHNYYSAGQLARVLFSTTITFDLAMFECFVPLTAGFTVQIAESILELVDSPEDFKQITLINTVPSAIREIENCQALPDQTISINLAGEVLTWDLVEKLYSHKNIAAVYNLWGPSEDTTYSTAYHCQKQRLNNSDNKVPIGHALTNKQIYILCAGKLYEKAKQGEVVIAGSGLALGYNDPNLDENRFVDDADINCRIYKTGDHGFINQDGLLHFNGRLDFQVKVRGHRIELEEIEAILLRHPVVSEVVVSPSDDLDYLQAVVRVSSADKITEQELSKHLLQYCPQYMLPSKWLLTDKLLPRTPNGKLSRRDSISLLEHEANHLDDSNDSELATIISQILMRKITADKSFIANGGSSLQAAKLVASMRNNDKLIKLSSILNPDIPISDLKTENLQLTADEDNKVDNSQKRFWQLLNSQKKPSAYNVSIEYIITGNIKLEPLVEAVTLVITKARLLVNFSDNGKPTNKKSSAAFEITHSQPMDDFYHTKFNLTDDILVRAACYKQNSKTILAFCMPHILIDGIGLELLAQQISNVYAGKDCLILDKPDTTIGVAKLELAKLFYKNKFDLPAIKWPQTKKPENDYCFSELVIDAGTLENLETIGKNNLLTMPAIFLALLRVGFLHFGLEKNLAIGIPFANRETVAEMNHIGNLVNTLPQIMQLNLEQTLADLLLETQQQLNSMQDFQDLPLETLLTELEIADNSPVLDIIFSYMDFAKDSLQLDGCTTSRNFPAQNAAKSPLVVSMISLNDNQALLRFEADCNYISAEQLLVIQQQVHNLLLSANDFLTIKLKAICLLSAADIKAIKQHNSNDVGIVAKQNISSKFAVIANKFSSNIAVIDGDNRINYQELMVLSDKIAANILIKSKGQPLPIGVIMQRSYKLVATLLGILKAGCYYVPLDPRNPELRNQKIINAATIKYIITDLNFVEYAQHISASDTDFHLNIKPDDLAYILFTSGTTGEPKGVQITHHNVCRLFTACDPWFEFSSNDVWSWFHSYAFDFSVWEIFGPLLSGAILLVVPEDASKNPLEFGKILQKEKVTILSQTPTAFKNLVSLERFDNSIRYIIYGGEAINHNDINSWQNNFNAQTKHINMYGITEITVHASFQDMQTASSDASIGVPLGDMNMVLLNDFAFPVAVGQVGEIYLSGPGLSNGYLNSAENNAASFKQLTVLDRTKRFYKSGDLAKLLPCGQFEYISRKDKQLKINGHRVEAGDIIAAISTIANLGTIYINIDKNNSGSDLLICYYNADVKIDASDISAELSTILPSYALPGAYIHVASFPLTINGKIDISQLPKNAIESIDQGDSLLQIWQDILNNKQFDMDKPFFEQGGSSIKAILLVKKINQLYQCSKKIITIVDIFRYPNFNSLSAVIEKRLSENN